MADDTKKTIARPGDVISIHLPNGASIKTQVEQADDRYIWVMNFLREDDRKWSGKLLLIRLGEDRNISFKAAVAGTEMIGRLAMTRLVAITQPSDNNRREAYRLQKLFDLSAYRKFEETVNEQEIACQGLDISDTGVGFATSQWFDYGEIIECRFSLGDARYQLTARVSRVIKQWTDGGEEIYRVGARFTRIGDNVRKKIRRYIYLQQAARRRGIRQDRNE